MDGRRAKTKVAVAGGSESLAALCGALACAEQLSLAQGHEDELDPSADAVLLELPDSDQPERALAAVRDATAAPVVLLAASAPASLVSWALDAGVADVIVEPYDAGGVLFAIEKAVRGSRDAAAGSPARIVTVFSPKGGTGKSAIATNLATTLARRSGMRTLLVDLDLQFGDAAIMLGLQPGKTVLDLVASPGELDADALDVYTQRHSSGLDVLPAPLRPEDAELVGDGAVRSVLGIARVTHDAVVVDTSPFFHESTLASLDLTDELLLVCSPDIPTVKNVRLALETLAQLSLPSHVSIVLNRDGDRSALRADDVAEALGRKLDFVLPFDPAVPTGVNRGAPATLEAAHGPFGEAITELAGGLFPELRLPALPRRRPSLRRRVVFARS